MTVYRPCVGCALQKKPCLRRDELSVSLKGHNVTSIKFRCPERAPLFTRGMPVWAFTWDGGDSDEDGIRCDHFPATVITESAGRIIVFIEPGVEGRDNDESNFTPSKSDGFCKLPLSRLTHREGESDPLCQDCDMPFRLGHKEGYICTMGSYLRGQEDGL